MATAAQIEANRRNAQKSTGPKTAQGKARARCNAYKHGLSTRSIMHVLPHEDPAELERRTQEYLGDMQPRNAIERDLVRQAARLSYQIERAERLEAAHLAARVREATQTEEISARRLEQVRELSRKLLYIVAPEDESYPYPPGSDDPAVFVRGLEETAEGCRWLLARWAEFRNLMNHKAWWGTSLMVRFIRLQGKQPVEAFYDPALNTIFLAWDVLAPKTIETFWHLYKKSASLSDPAYKHLLRWDDIAPRPQYQEEASAILHEVVDGHVERLEFLLARHETITAEEAAARADRAALDCSKEFERHRRYQSARTRSLLRTLDTLRRMRKAELGTGNGEAENIIDEWQIGDDTCQLAADTGQMADDACRTADGTNKKLDRECPLLDDGCEVAPGERTSWEETCEGHELGCAEERNTEPMVRKSSDPVRELDGDRFMDHETKKATIKANPKSPQSYIAHCIEADSHGSLPRERTHFRELQNLEREPMFRSACSKDPDLNSTVSKSQSELGVIVEESLDTDGVAAGLNT
jgi:hypothetical protein